MPISSYGSMLLPIAMQIHRENKFGLKVTQIA